MGYDSSYHPIAIDFVQEQLLPYLLGEGDIEPLLRSALLRNRIRARAKAWALAVHRLSPAPRRFDPHLHLWGRPFFIVVDDTEVVLDTYDLYLTATDEQQVDAIALEQLHAIAPGLTAPVQSLFQAPPAPPQEELLGELRWRLDILRSAVAAVRQGGAQIEARGRLHDPRALLRREVPFAVLSFTATLAPGWMSRGVTWPTALLDAVPLPLRPFFEKPSALLGPLPQALPGQSWFLYDTIVENYMVGGLVAPSYVAPLRRFLADQQGALLAAQPEAERAELRRELRKIKEALALAQRKGWAFAEATEVYSGLQGSLN
jgi:hypothetical protein